MNYLYASYSHTDLEAVEPIVKALGEAFGSRSLPVSVWFNQDELQPGQDWTAAITRALRECIGLLVFISPSSIASQRVGQELLVVMEKPDSLIIPVILESIPNLPPELAGRQAFDLNDIKGASADNVVLQTALQQIVDLVEEYLERDSISPPVSPSAAPVLAATIAEETRDVQQKPTSDGSAPNSVFVVHGHDNTMLDEINAYLSNLGVKIVVLAKIAGQAQSLFQKFLASSAKARFAIVILTPDDLGVSRRQYNAPNVGTIALQFRARQNVILELGFFYGRLGWENVFVVYRNPEAYPNFERPSDLEGVVFVEMDATGQWQEVLTDKLNEAGFQISRPD